MDKPTIEHHFIDYLTKSFEKLCEGHHLGIPKRVIADPFIDLDHRIASALVGFVGENIRGSIVLSGTPRIFEISNPSYVDGKTDPELAKNQSYDWIGEMANQLMGRFKNAVMKHDVDFGISPPTVVLANEVVFGLVGGTERENLFFDVGDSMSVTIRLQLHCNVAVNFDNATKLENLTEGTAMLF